MEGNNKTRKKREKVERTLEDQIQYYKALIVRTDKLLKRALIEHAVAQDPTLRDRINKAAGL